jgi:hypothetical protein
VKKKKPAGRHIDELLLQGVPPHDIAARLGCVLGYVRSVKNAGGYDAYLALNRASSKRWSRAHGCAPRGSTSHLAKRPRSLPLPKYPEVIAAVDAGMTFSEAARKFHSSRGVIAGILKRRPEARG